MIAARVTSNKTTARCRVCSMREGIDVALLAKVATDTTRDVESLDLCGRRHQPARDRACVIARIETFAGA